MTNDFLDDLIEALDTEKRDFLFVIKSGNGCIVRHNMENLDNLEKNRVMEVVGASVFMEKG